MTRKKTAMLFCDRTMNMVVFFSSNVLIFWEAHFLRDFEKLICSAYD